MVIIIVEIDDIPFCSPLSTAVTFPNFCAADPIATVDVAIWGETTQKGCI